MIHNKLLQLGDWKDLRGVLNKVYQFRHPAKWMKQGVNLI